MKLKNIIGGWKQTYHQKRWFRWVVRIMIVFVLFLIIVPAPRFQTPYSTVLYSKDSVLLNARVAKDEQWRFAEEKNLPPKYVRALIQFEDKGFYYHPGVNPIAIFRALTQNFRSGKVVSGGSTITMQLARIYRGNPKRTIPEKIWEMLIALKAECVYSKQRILEKYAAHAPFGSNVVGLHAACWRFFGVEPDRLSWAQAATLAVLPNSPALIFPGKNQERLRAKRNKLLRQLHEAGKMSDDEFSLSIEEPVPGLPNPMPQSGSELAVRLTNEGQAGQTIYTTLDADLQHQTEEIVERYHQIYLGNHIHNIAALVIKIATGEVMAYVGNASDTLENQGNKVDAITALRSYGSTLKPVLYMASLDAGKIGPGSLLPDYPMNFGGFSPKNYNLEYDGVVPADRALIRSLNIPNVFLLKEFGTGRFLSLLQNMGMTTFPFSARHYGLSLILGGGETSLWELTGLYAALAHKLNTGTPKYEVYFQQDKKIIGNYNVSTVSQPAIWQAFQTMTELYRPGDDGHWENFSSTQKIAWKTGTSFGSRDGWAIGVNSEYAVGVWVGNATGEGRPGLTGTDYAAPILFDLFSRLPTGRWFRKPLKGWKKIKICRESGLPAGAFCPHPLMEMVPEGCVKAPTCTYHQQIFLDPGGNFQVNSSCMSPSDMKPENWFVLNPAEALYYAAKHSDYLPLPPFRSDCVFGSYSEDQPISLIYPSDGSRIYIPKDRNGREGKVIFSAADRNPAATLFWHADDHYLGETKGTHRMEINVGSGEHRFTLVDDAGNSLSFKITFLQSQK